MKLIRPHIDYKASYIAYIQELGDEERYPFPLDFDFTDFAGLLQKIEDFAAGRNLPTGFVPSSTLWLVDDDEIVGVTNLRHYLNSEIAYCGGHIGLGIRPSRRGFGLGTHLMDLSVKTLNNMGVKDIHIHCYEHNAASAKCIEGVGGVLDSTVEIDNKTVQRFVVR